VYQSNISRHKVELKQPQYKDIEKRYSNQLIQLKVHLFLLIYYYLIHFKCLQKSPSFYKFFNEATIFVFPKKKEEYLVNGEI
jgi:hypothetical protein